MVAASELPINTGASALQMAQEIFGAGVTVVNASYTGDNRSSGIYSNGDSISPEATPGDTGVILSTGKARDFTNSSGDANHSPNTSTDTSGLNNDPAFDALAGVPTRDAAFLDVDFIPDGNLMTMQFVLSSEEYPEFFSQYTDTIGVWINGNPVQIAVGNGQASVGNINNSSNINQYVDNTADQANTEMDGYTITLSLKIPVNDGEVNSIRIGIADAVDSVYDSNLLIAGGSVQTALVAQNDAMTMVPNGSQMIDVLANDTNSSGGALTITHINGQAVSAGDTVTLPSGHTVTLTASGTLIVTADADTDTVSFTYEVTDASGETDVAFVTVETVPCFVAGTKILTPAGERAVESLRPGDLVMTRDEGPQPVRWIGRRRVAGRGNAAPVCISAGTFGAHGDLMVSPEHRILLCESGATLLFGVEEVLIAAKDLVGHRAIRRREGAIVEYVHLMLDRHQILCANGLASESFLPGPQTSACFPAEALDEIAGLFPGLDPMTGAGYGKAARRTLKSWEASLLLNHRAVA